jgi:hypothetical protein
VEVIDMQSHYTESRDAATQPKQIKVGEPFNPYKLFTGIFIPEGVYKYKGLTAGAKLVYGRLCRYAGEDGKCFPAIQTLAAEMGIGATQTRKYVAELETHAFIRRDGRNGERLRYVFLGHDAFHGDVGESRKQPPPRKTVPQRITDGVPQRETVAPPQRKTDAEDSQIKRVNGRESGIDYDCPTRFRKNHESSSGGGVSQSTAWLSGYPNVREWLRQYMKEDAPDLPSEQAVIRIIQATSYAAESEIRTALLDLHRRGYDHTHVQTYAWFISALEDYFTAKTNREQMRTPVGYHEWEDRNVARGVA